MTSARDANYERERVGAEEDGTALQEQEGDFPPADLYHAAQALADALGNDLTEHQEVIGVPDTDPTRWERLDVARVASYARHHRGEAFTSLLSQYPWLAEYADSASHDAMGALSDQF